MFGPGYDWARGSGRRQYLFPEGWRRRSLPCCDPHARRFWRWIAPVPRDDVPPSGTPELLTARHQCRGTAHRRWDRSFLGTVDPRSVLGSWSERRHHRGSRRSSRERAEGEVALSPSRHRRSETDHLAPRRGGKGLRGHGGGPQHNGDNTSNSAPAFPRASVGQSSESDVMVNRPRPGPTSSRLPHGPTRSRTTAVGASMSTSTWYRDGTLSILDRTNSAASRRAVGEGWRGPL